MPASSDDDYTPAKQVTWQERLLKDAGPKKAALQQKYHHETSPMVDARLSDGSRVNAIIPPLAVDGPVLSIRRFSVDKLTPPDLVARKATTPGMMELLEACVRAKLSICRDLARGPGQNLRSVLHESSSWKRDRLRAFHLLFHRRSTQRLDQWR
jgi:hypothetical protein